MDLKKNKTKKIKSNIQGIKNIARHHEQTIQNINPNIWASFEAYIMSYQHKKKWSVQDSNSYLWFCIYTSYWISEEQ